MSEESQNDGTMSGLLKTVIGTVGTIVTAGGAWLGSQMFGGGEQPAAQPAAAPVINITQNQAQQQAASGGKTIIINKGGDGNGSAKPAQPAPAPKPKKEADEFKEKPAAW
jgi:hypothetical protein